jgi:hypothetical protein
MTNPTPEEIRAAALRYLASGLSIIPIGENKTPIGGWLAFQNRHATEKQAEQWFNADASHGIAVLGGSISGGVEVLDFDDPEALPLWRDLLEDHSPGLFERLPLIATPGGGYQIPYRCPDFFARLPKTEQEKKANKEKFGNQKLARRKVIVEDSQLDSLHASVETVGTEGHQKQVLKIFFPQSNKTKTAQRETIEGREVWTYIEEIIETRAEGGYVATFPSPALCHPTGKLYSFVAGDWCDLPIITEDERLVMIALAISLDEMPEIHAEATERVESRPLPKSADNTLSVGDDFNLRANWSDVLEPHGWRFLRTSGGASYWKRPGDSKAPHSAITNGKGTDTLAVFTTATVFEDVMSRGTTYSKFGAYAYLNHNGDFKEATKDLGAQGYGNQEWKPRQPISEGEEVSNNVIALANLDYAVTVAFACWNISDAGYRTFQAVKQIFNGRKVWGLPGSLIARHIKSTASLEAHEPSESDKSFGNRRLKSLIRELSEKVNHRIFTVHEKGRWKDKKAARYRLDLSIFETLMQQPEDLSLTFEKAVYQKASELRIQTLKTKKEKDAITKIFDYREALIKKSTKLADCLSQVHGENIGDLAREANQIAGAVAEKIFRGIPPNQREFFELEKNIIRIAGYDSLKNRSRKASEKSSLVAENLPENSLKNSRNPYQTQQDTESLVAENSQDFSLKNSHSEQPETAKTPDGFVTIESKLNNYTDKSIQNGKIEVA